MKRLFPITLLLLSTTIANAETWDESIRRLCVSTQQDACWVKAGSALCDADQISCKNLPDHAYARVIKKAGKRWQVETIYGTGWVSERMMMIDGDK